MKIAIKGHESRGKEVIQILKSLGGINTWNHLGNNFDCYYEIHGNTIICVNTKSERFKYYTLEEFEKEFPFKIGDEVTIVGLPDFPKIITQMVWDCDEILYSFEGLNNTWFGAKSLKKLEMKEKRNITLTLDKAKEWYNKGGELKEIALQVFTEKELNPLPRSWEEYCRKYGMVCLSARYTNISLKYDALLKLEQLRNCWRQNWIPKIHAPIYAVKFSTNGLKVYQYNSREFLSFPTKEMAEEFLECFRDLIEKAGDLI